MKNMAKIIAEEGSLKGLVLELQGGNEWLVGRDPDESQLVLGDPSVSRKHILLRSTPQGILLENVAESNPVFVNDEEIHAPQMLHHGDSVKIGNGYYRFYAEEAARVEDLELPPHRGRGA